MAQAKTELDLEEAFVENDQEDTESSDNAPAKTSSLAKRRDIDNLLEERRLRKQLAEYDYDL